MRLLSEDDVVKVVDQHTKEDGRLDDDITCILEEVPTANILNVFSVIPVYPMWIFVVLLWTIVFIGNSTI